MLSISQIAKTKVLVHRKNVARTDRRQLWNEAAKSVRDSKTSGIDQDLIGSDISIDDVRAAVQNKLDECIQKRWAYTRSNGREIRLWDVLDKVMQWVNKFKTIGDVAVQYDPGHAALPWAAIRFVLQASVSSVETFGHKLEGVRTCGKNHSYICRSGNCMPKRRIQTQNAVGKRTRQDVRWRARIPIEGQSIFCPKLWQTRPQRRFPVIPDYRRSMD